MFGLEIDSSSHHMSNRTAYAYAYALNCRQWSFDCVKSLQHTNDVPLYACKRFCRSLAERRSISSLCVPELGYWILNVYCWRLQLILAIQIPVPGAFEHWPLNSCSANVVTRVFQVSAPQVHMTFHRLQTVYITCQAHEEDTSVAFQGFSEDETIAENDLHS